MSSGREFQIIGAAMLKDQSTNVLYFVLCITSKWVSLDDLSLLLVVL